MKSIAGSTEAVAQALATDRTLANEEEERRAQQSPDIPAGSRLNPDMPLDLRDVYGTRWDTTKSPNYVTK